MKAVLVLIVLATLAMIFLQYKRRREGKKLLLSIGSFATIVSLAIAGNLTRSVPPIFFAHLVLLVLAWGALVWYMVRDRLYWWLILSPLATIILFVVMELIMGSGHENLGEIV